MTFFSGEKASVIVLSYMSKLQMLRASVKQRLDAAAEEICGLFERTIADYEEELSCLKENDRQHKLLDAVFNPEVQLHRSVFPGDVQQLLVIKEEVPPEWSPSPNQEDPELRRIKEEQEGLWTSQEGEQLNGLEEADITRFPFRAIPVKSEDDEEKPQSPQLHQSQTEGNREAEPPASSSAREIKTETEGEDRGGSETARNLDPDSRLQPNTDEKASDSSETEISNDDWQEPLSDSGPETEDSQKTNLKVHMQIHTAKKTFGCGVCGKRFNQKKNLKRHMRVHTGEKPFGCEACGKRFIQQENLKTHLKVHTGEKPFGCDACGKRFTVQGHLKRHMRVHTGEKPFGCEACGKRFTQQGKLTKHEHPHRRETIWL